MQTTTENKMNDFLKTLEEEDLTTNISKISFIFIAFLVIAGGYTTQIFSCSTQRFLSSNIYGKHLIGIGLIFVFIMLEGGWDFDKKEQEKHSVDWSNGNCIDSMMYAFVIYFILLISSKMRIGWNALLFGLLFVLYFVNTQRLYYFNRNRINKGINQQLIDGEKKVMYSLPFILTIGVVDYFFYKKAQMGKAFSFYLFFLGSATCRNL
tara:strand:- start:2457 stop:3080 length:624 start_codon:yes stop_codon:yes gene_type:complete